MLYYLSLLTHTDQLAFFRLFKYLTFRSGAAVVTALLIAFLINPMLIRWLKVKQG
jgi:phospho-N-acetylmuramoyl-pentapeptide-transferase